MKRVQKKLYNSSTSPSFFFFDTSSSSTSLTLDIRELIESPPLFLILLLTFLDALAKATF